MDGKASNRQPPDDQYSILTSQHTANNSSRKKWMQKNCEQCLCVIHFYSPWAVVLHLHVGLQRLPDHRFPLFLVRSLVLLKVMADGLSASA